MDFSIDLGLGGWGLLLVGAVVIGVVLQLIGEAKFGYEWMVTAVGAGIGALVASEFIVGWRAFAPVIDGLAVVPALIGGVLAGVVVDVAIRVLTGGRYFRHVTA